MFSFSYCKSGGWFWCWTWWWNIFEERRAVEVLDQTDTDWWKGSLNGKVGLFPSSYLEKSSISIPKSEPAPVTIAPPANQEPGELKLNIMHIVHS